MFLIIFGTRSSKVKEQKIKGSTICSKCNKMNTYRVSGSIKYFYLFFIPFISISRRINFKCTNCNNVYLENTAPKPIRRAYMKSPIKVPIWHFSGMLLIGTCLSVIIIYNMVNDYESYKDGEKIKEYKVKLKSSYENDILKVVYNPIFEKDSISFTVNEALDFTKYSFNKNNIKYFSRVSKKKILLIIDIQKDDEINSRAVQKLMNDINDIIKDNYFGKTLENYIVIRQNGKLLITKGPYKVNVNEKSIMYFYEDIAFIDDEDNIAKGIVFIKKYKDYNKSKIKIDSTNLNKLFKKVLKKYNFLYEKLPLKDISNWNLRFYEVTELYMPKEIEILVKTNNGIGPFKSISDIISDCDNNIYKFHKFFDIEDLNDSQYKDKEGKIIPSPRSPYWIPFYEDNTNIYAIDLLPNINGNIGQIICYGNDEKKNKVVAKNMEEFLYKYLHGKIDVDIDGWTKDKPYLRE